MCNSIGERLGNGFVLGSVPGKCNCGCRCSYLQEKGFCRDANEPADGDFMSSIGAALILLALLGFSQNRIDGVDDLRKRVDAFHQELLDVIDETERKAKELQEEGIPDEV